MRHARIHNQLASDPQYAGGIGWCAFDYNTHSNFGAGDRICYHGVTDIFREPKPAAGFYKSQCDPAEEIVLEPAFHWAKGDESVGFSKAVVCSNCDHLKFYMRERSLETNPWKLVAELDPDREQFEHLTWPPFVLELSKMVRSSLIFTGETFASTATERQAGHLQIALGLGVDRKFLLLPDDKSLVADGADTTRVVLRVTDEFGAMRTYANDPIRSPSKALRSSSETIPSRSSAEQEPMDSSERAGRHGAPYGKTSQARIADRGIQSYGISRRSHLEPPDCHSAAKRRNLQSLHRLAIGTVL